MKQRSLVLIGKRNLEWQSRLVETLEKDEVLIETITGAISIGAEIPQYNESDVTDTSPHYPRETGYESYGRVLETGSEVSVIKAGDRVLSFYGHKNVGIVKAHKVVRVPEFVDDTYALLNTLSCDAAKGVLKLSPRTNDKVLVTGAGTIGLLAVHFLRNYMNVQHVDVVEPNKARRELARMMGARTVFHSGDQVSSANYKCSLECSSSQLAFATIQRALMKNGEVCVLSDGNKDLFYLTEGFYEKELKVVGSSDGWDYQKHSEWFFGCYHNSVYIKEIFELEINEVDLISCFEKLSESKTKPIKVLVRYNGSEPGC